MFRSQAIRSFQTVSTARQTAVKAARRSYANATYPPPPAGSPAPNPKRANESDNTLLYAGLGLAAGAGAYYYFKGGKEESLNEKTKRDEERIRVNSREAKDALKDRAQDAIDRGRAKVDNLENKAKESYDTARARVTGTGPEAQGRGLFDRAEETIDAAKRSTKETVGSARSSTESLYRDAKGTAHEYKSDAERRAHELRADAERKAEELRNDADRKGEEVKEGWFSWLGYGKQKVNEGQDAVKDRELRLEGEAEHLKREGAQKVATAAEDVRRRAEKHA